MDPAFMRECHSADDRFIGCERDLCQLGYEGRECIDLGRIDPGIIAVQLFKHHHDLFEGHVSCPLSHPVDGRVGTGRSRS